MVSVLRELVKKFTLIEIIQSSSNERDKDIKNGKDGVYNSMLITAS